MLHIPTTPQGALVGRGPDWRSEENDMITKFPLLAQGAARCSPRGQAHSEREQLHFLGLHTVLPYMFKIPA